MRKRWLRDWLFILRCHWEAVRWHRSFAALASLNDSDFMATLSDLQKHPAYTVRVACGIRWSRITWPNDHPDLHAADARLLFERRRTG